MSTTSTVWLDEVVELYKRGLGDGSAGPGMAFVPHPLHEHRLKRAALAIERIKPKSLLDVGCGIGLLSKLVTCPYHGVDPVEELITIAQKSARPGATFQTGTAIDVEGEYEMVVSLGVMSHIPPHEAEDFLRPAISPSTKYLLVEAQHPDLYHGVFYAHHPASLHWIFVGLGFDVHPELDIDFDGTKDSAYRILGVRK